MLNVRLEANRLAVRELTRRAETIEASQETLKELEQHVLRAQALIDQHAESSNARFIDLTAIAERLNAQMAHIDYRFACRPYMSEDLFGTAGDLTRPMGYGLDAATLHLQDGRKAGFADVFRGSTSFISERQRTYLPFFQGRRNVVDLGCGRGEF